MTCHTSLYILFLPVKRMFEDGCAEWWSQDPTEAIEPIGVFDVFYGDQIPSLPEMEEQQPELLLPLLPEDSLEPAYMKHLPTTPTIAEDQLKAAKLEKLRMLNAISRAKRNASITCMLKTEKDDLRAAQMLLSLSELGGEDNKNWECCCRTDGGDTKWEFYHPYKKSQKRVISRNYKITKVAEAWAEAVRLASLSPKQ